MKDYGKYERDMYWVCCPMCDNEKCVRGTPECEAKQWVERKLKEEQT